MVLSLLANIGMLAKEFSDAEREKPLVLIVGPYVQCKWFFRRDPYCFSHQRWYGMRALKEPHGTFVKSIFWAGIWTAYLLKSGRVRNTYVRENP